MECPECGEEIQEVSIISLFHQTAKLEGNKIVEYEKPDAPTDSIYSIECPECNEDIQLFIETKKIEEKMEEENANQS